MEKEIYEHSGIEEHRGKIPWWLIVVYVSLGLWGLYYLVKYWGGLGPGIGY